MRYTGVCVISRGRYIEVLLYIKIAKNYVIKLMTRLVLFSKSKKCNDRCYTSMRKNTNIFMWLMLYKGFDFDFMNDAILRLINTCSRMLMKINIWTSTIDKVEFSLFHRNWKIFNLNMNWQVCVTMNVTYNV